MKFNFLQEDFSAGELSPRAQGHVESEAYKAGLKLAANVAPTRAGSLASRAGGKHLFDAVEMADNLKEDNNLSGRPVQHIPLHDGPYGDCIVEVHPTGLRLMDKNGLIPWNFYPTSELLQFIPYQFDAGGNPLSWGDKYGSVYMTNRGQALSVQYVLTKGIANVLRNTDWAALPAGTNETWTLSGKMAGDPFTMEVFHEQSATLDTFAVAPGADGTFSVTFDPRHLGAVEDFFIRLHTPITPASTALWDIQLIKNGTVLQAYTAFSDTGGRPTEERIRWASFWISKDQPYKGLPATFWTALAGGPNGEYAGYALSWTQTNSIHPGIWSFGQMPVAMGLDLIQGANVVAVYQDRLWYGNNKAAGRPQIIASMIGFQNLFDQGISTIGGTPGATQAMFVFKVPEDVYTFIGVNGGRETINSSIGGSGDAKSYCDIVRFNIPAYTPLVTPDGYSLGGFVAAADTGSWAGVPNLQVKRNGVILTQQVKPNYKNADPAQGLEAPDNDKYYAVAPIYNLFGGNNSTAMGNVIFPTGIVQAGDILKFSTIPLAPDPLNLTIASPSGDIAFLNVLRGLVLGTTRVEKRFTQNAPLTIDPSSGQSFEVDDESSSGAASQLTALDINDRVLFAQLGRKVLRMAGISIATDGGLVAEDVGVAGEHLTNARIRSMCFLKSPVPRVVMAFDDGTGAVMSLVGKGQAFSRFTLPAQFGGIYNVAALNVDDADSQLWVGTDNGVTLYFDTFESDIISKTVLFDSGDVTPPQRIAYDTENPLPPVMDGWKRLPLLINGAVQYVTGLSVGLSTSSVWIVVNGQVQGPLPCSVDGVTGLPMVDLTTLGLSTTWVDENGLRRAQEVYVGLAFADHHWTTLPLEGGNPVGTSQNLTSRKPQLWLRFVDSYLPLVNGTRCEERGPDDPVDLLAGRVTGDRRATEMNFQRAAVVDVVMDKPLRMEVSAVFGGAVMNNI